MVSVKGPSFDYYAILEDDGSFCIHEGVYPESDQGTLWCAGQASTAAQSQTPLLYPADCPLERWQATGQDIHSLVADPLFADPDNGDFTLSPNSPALKLGFQPIDTSTVGPRVR